MDNISKLNSLNIYTLLKKFISTINSSENENNEQPEITPEILKPISDVFSSITNESFVIFKVEASPTKIFYFKYLIDTSLTTKSNFEIIETPQEIKDKNIISINYNKFNLFFNLDKGSTYTVISQNNLDFESLSLSESMKLTGILSKKHITKISCGDTHAIFLTQSGTVFSIGDNTYGQLGIGENEKIQQCGEAIMIQDLLNFNITDIFAGNDHSMCFGSLRELSKNNNNSNRFSPLRMVQYLFVWGDNSHGQLGIKIKKNNIYNNSNKGGTNEIILKPTKLSLNENPHSYAISGDYLINLTGGLLFSVVLLSSGKLFTFGDNQYNQIITINKTERPCLMSKHIPKDYGKIIRAMASANSLLLITDKNKLLIFGKFNSPLLDSVLIVDLLKYDENMKFIFTDTKIKYLTYDENVKNPKIFGKVEKEKIENMIDKAYEQVQKERKNITRKNLGNNSTLRERNEISFFMDEKSMDLGLDISREELSNSVIISSSNKNKLEFKTSFNEYLNELNINMSKNNIDIETHEKNYLNDYDKKVKEYLKNSQNDINQFNKENLYKNINKQKNKNNALHNNNDNLLKENNEIKKNDKINELNNTNINLNKDTDSKIITDKKPLEKELNEKNNMNSKKDINNQTNKENIYNKIEIPKEKNNNNNTRNLSNNKNNENNNKNIQEKVVEKKEEEGEFQLSDLLGNEEEDNSIEYYSTNINEKEKENNKTNKKLEINLSDIKNKTCNKKGNISEKRYQNNSDEEDNNSFSIFKNHDSDKDIKNNNNNDKLKTKKIANYVNTEANKNKSNINTLSKNLNLTFNNIDNMNNSVIINNNKIKNNNIDLNKSYNENFYNNKNKNIFLDNALHHKNNFYENIFKRNKNKDNNNYTQQTIMEEIRELGQFLSNTINKYSKQRSDTKKELFFEQLISSYYNPKITNLDKNIIAKNVISGVPNRFRGRFWLKFIKNKLSITPEEFKLNLQKYDENNKDNINNNKYILPFSYLGIFKENNPLTNDLNQVLNAFSISQYNVQYTENISYLLGVLLINMDKYQSYQCLINLINNKNRIIYYEKKEKNSNNHIYGNSDTPTGDDESIIVQINLRRVIFKQLFFFNLPDLCSHLELLNILPENYFDEWCATLFSKNFNIDIVMRIWDLYVILGEKIIFNAGVVLLKELEEDLFKCEEKEEALEILLNNQEREINENNILNNILKVKYPEWIKNELKTINQETLK